MTIFLFKMDHKAFSLTAGLDIHFLIIGKSDLFGFAFLGLFNLKFG